jgi:hypothetical protein
MSVLSNTSSTMNKADILALISTLETQMSALRTMIDSIPEPKSTKRASKPKKNAAPVPVAPAPSPAPVSDAASTVSSASKPKREINPQIVEYNKQRNQIFAELRSNWLNSHPDLAALARAAWVDLPESAPKDVKKAHNKAVRDFKDAVKNANTDAPPTYPDALKEHSRRLKATPAPAPEPVPAPSTPKPTKKPSKKQSKPAPTPAPEPDSASVPTATEPAKKRRGRPSMTAEQKAAAKAARKAAKKAAKKLANVPALPASPPESDSLDTDSESDNSGSDSD